jgi:hypothetical protein
MKRFVFSIDWNDPNSELSPALYVSSKAYWNRHHKHQEAADIEMTGEDEKAVDGIIAAFDPALRGQGSQSAWYIDPWNDGSIIGRTKSYDKVAVYVERFRRHLLKNGLIDLNPDSIHKGVVAKMKRFESEVMKCHRLLKRLGKI